MYTSKLKRMLYFTFKVLGLRIRIFLGLPDPDPLLRIPDPDPDPSELKYCLIKTLVKTTTFR